MSDEKRPTAHAPVSRRTKGHVKALRAQMTDAEVALWRRLRGHRFAGAAFRRQVPMGPYIGDFVCHAARLIVEVDGGQHGESRDVTRDAWFAARGYRVIRYWNSDVLGNLEGVLADLASQLAAQGGCADGVIPPSPTLPRKGGGGRSRGLNGPRANSGSGEPSPLAGEGGEGGNARAANATSATALTEQNDNKTSGAGGHD